MNNDSSLKVLLVEDNPVNQKVTLYQLKSLGYLADVSASGQEALARMAESDYDLILTNCEMPGMDGYALTEAIRRLEVDAVGDRPLPVVVLAMNADNTPQEQSRCLAVGMNDVLSKPVRKDELALKLEQWSQKIFTARSQGSTSEVPLEHPAPAASPDQDGSNPPLDWEHLHQMSDDSYEFEIELLTVFVEDAQVHLKAVTTAIAESNYWEVEQAAHHIKGASANVGAKTMQAAAAEIEQQARRQKLEGTAQLLTEIEQALTSIEKFVQKNS
ncbi:response regulator [Trichocoleus sp. FACHB-262]|uniref:response regulator n=1 Tax=Trichocoleus sp. FACHB-262 TaxID=2692869 RepID=UPI00168246BF|nr:response regulator [Trichocoleus sp. FACHB-262]MBD2123892.1 response regulator [Trichocoleus sp. FACHB-262]